MARVAVNPTVLAGDSDGTGLELIPVLATNSKTWKKGELGYFTSGAVSPVVTTGVTSADCIFADDQSTSTSATTVWVYLLRPGVRMLIYVSATGVAGTAASATLGTKYGVYGASNITYLDTDTRNGAFQVIRKYSTANPEEDGWSDADAAPGLVEVEFSNIS